MEVLLFDFEFFIGGQRQKLMTLPCNLQYERISSKSFCLLQFKEDFDIMVDLNSEEVFIKCYKGMSMETV